MVVGGYGVFGRRIVHALAACGELNLVAAGRDGAAATAFCVSLAPLAATALETDVSTERGRDRLLAARPAIVIDAAGPFQSRVDGLARACAESGIHYIDIADDRARVGGITVLNATARSHNALCISGASTVPAITTAIVDALAPVASSVVAIDVGISPGHQAPRGIATVRAVLGYAGRPIAGIAERIEYGWGNLGRHRYPDPVGSRWLSNVDTPERGLWSRRYPALDTMTIRAGLEVSVLHLGLSALSRGVRSGILGGLGPRASAALRIANALGTLGSDAGALHVRVVTRDADGVRRAQIATLVAEHGDGPQIPATPAVLLVKKILGLPGYQPLSLTGAVPCMGLFTLGELLAEFSGFHIRFVHDVISEQEAQGGR